MKKVLTTSRTRAFQSWAALSLFFLGNATAGPILFVATGTINASLCNNPGGSSGVGPITSSGSCTGPGGGSGLINEYVDYNHLGIYMGLSWNAVTGDQLNTDVFFRDDFVFSSPGVAPGSPLNTDFSVLAQGFSIWNVTRTCSASHRTFPNFYDK
jgi:hypothetical protein